MAREDLDFVVNLGDYIYAEAYHSRADGTGVRDDRSRPLARGRVRRRSRSTSTATSTSSTARTPRCGRCTRASRWSRTWDDHEVQNDYAGGATRRRPAVPASASREARRRDAGYKAFFEQMPTFAAPRGRDRLYRTLRFGRNVDLFMLDERQYRADQPCGDARRPEPCPEYNNPRTLLGQARRRSSRPRSSSSKATWKLIGNEVVMMPVKTGTNSTSPRTSGRAIRASGARASSTSTKGVKDVVFLTGDYPHVRAGDVQITEGGESVATEFVGGSVSTSLAPARATSRSAAA